MSDTRPFDDAYASDAEVAGWADLVHAVQIRRLFRDSKTFIDALALKPRAEVVREFKAGQPMDDTALAAFVRSNFQLPDEDRSSDHLPAPQACLKNHIRQMWPRLTRLPPTVHAASSKLALPFPYLSPGGRFRELYYWDSYFSMLGLARDGHQDLIEAMIGNFTTLLERFGFIPNGSRTYYVTRSQPPVFHLMLEFSRDLSPATLRRRLDAMRAEHSFWMRGAEALAPGSAARRAVRMRDGAVLNRYWDDADHPRAEAYVEDLATVRRRRAAAPATYRELRAAAESGWDFSSRWLSDHRSLGSIRTTSIVPVDLNCLLFGLEQAIARTAFLLADEVLEQRFAARARSRRRAIQRHHWGPAAGRFGDACLGAHRLTRSVNSAGLFPLFAGVATADQARAMARLVRRRLLAPGGLRTTTRRSAEQWDKPNGWAPLQWIAVSGLRRYGEYDLAREIAARWSGTVERVFRTAGTVLEKYDVERSLPGRGGEYPVQAGFGWTNGVVREFYHLYPELADC